MGVPVFSLFTFVFLHWRSLFQRTQFSQTIKGDRQGMPMRATHNFCTIAAFVLLASQVHAGTAPSTVLAVQDFEVAPVTPTWLFSGPVIYNSGFSSAAAAPPDSPLGIDGSRAWETTTNSGGLVLTFDNQVIAPGFDSIEVRFRLAAMALTASTGGPDNLDYVRVEISIDGGTTYYSRLRIRGAVNDNSFWPYAATGVAQVGHLPQSEVLFQPLTSGLQTAEGYSTAAIIFPGDVGQLGIRITARSSSSTDTWLIDNLTLSGLNGVFADGFEALP